MLVRAAIVCALLVVAGAGCGGSKKTSEARGAPPVWPAPPNPMELTRKAGLTPESGGVPPVPRARASRRLLQRRARRRPGGHRDRHEATRRCELTPKASGCAATATSRASRRCTPTRRTASCTRRRRRRHPNTLGQFFVEWDVDLDAGRVGEYSEETRRSGSTSTARSSTATRVEIELSDGREIAIVIGSAARRDSVGVPAVMAVADTNRVKSRRREARPPLLVGALRDRPDPRSRAPRAATSGTTTASAISTSRRSSSTSRSATSTRRSSPRSRSRPTG